MTEFILYKNKDFFTGYEAKGHSTENADDFSGKLVCSAVSSAVIMTANTITDIICDKSEITLNEGYLKLVVGHCNQRTQLVLEGLWQHINALSEEYPDKIKVKMEVRNHVEN